MSWSRPFQKIDTEYDSPTSFFVNYTLSVTDEALIALQMDLKEIMEKYMSLEIKNHRERRIAQACFQVFLVTKISQPIPNSSPKKIQKNKI